MNRNILNLQNDLALNPQFSGGKGSNLAQLTRAGFSVPPFFILSSSLYEHIIKINSIDKIIKEAASDKSLENFRKVQSAILKAEIPDSIISQTNHVFKNLIKNTVNKKVAVRSSALTEDLRDRSFAGQLESYLNIQNEKQLIESIKKCWASLWNERIYAYQSREYTQFTLQPMAVIVQQMIPAQISGICFTTVPTDDKREFMMIEAHGGSGAEIVSGKVNPVNYRVDRRSLEISSENQAKKQPDLLSKEQIIQLARTCLKIEATFSSPQDIEWGSFQDKFYIFQSRPITTTGNKVTLLKDKLWSNYFFGERFPQPVSPLGWSLLKPLIEKNAFRQPLNFLGFHRLARSRITKCFYGRPYTKLSAFQALHSFFPTAYVSLDKRRLFYEKQISLQQSIAKILKNIFPIIKSVLSTTDWIPPIHLRNWRRFLNLYREKIQTLNQLNLHVMSDEQLWQINGQAEHLSHRLLSLHRWSITFAELLYHFLIYLISKWLPQVNAEKTVIELHRGIPGNKTVEMSIELWKMSRYYRFHPPIGGWNRYQKSFLKKFGHRSTSLDIAVPTFADDKTYLLELAQHYQSQQPEVSPAVKHEKFEQQRQQSLQSVCQNLSDQAFGFLKTKFFKILLNWSEQLFLLRENQRHYWHQALAITRKIFSEIGARFVDRGWQEKPEHIFFLTRNEAGQAIFQQKLVSKFEIEKRIMWHQQWQKIQPPVIIDESVPIQLDVKTTNKKLIGIGASPGVVTGQSRVLNAVQQMAQIQPGDILVVPTTDPGWTPLFGMIQGLVMEVGGVLSHGAIVAREFGIPAVTSLVQATTRIVTGMKITIDGTNGEVWIHED